MPGFTAEASFYKTNENFPAMWMHDAQLIAEETRTINPQQVFGPITPVVLGQICWISRTGIQVTRTCCYYRFPGFVRFDCTTVLLRG
jgi:hypothetical protein